MRRRIPVQRLLGAVPVLFFATGAWAAEPAASHWDDRHMRSNFAVRLHEDVPRPPIQIGEPADGHTQVREMLLAISPHAWQPGVASFGTSSPRAVGGTGDFPPVANLETARSSALRGVSGSFGQRRGSRF